MGHAITARFEDAFLYGYIRRTRSIGQTHLEKVQGLVVEGIVAS
jgi:hypothetical protein